MLVMTNEAIIELEDISIKISQSKNKEKIKNTNRCWVVCGTMQKDLTYKSLESQNEMIQKM